jgi:hypothetical protein
MNRRGNNSRPGQDLLWGSGPAEVDPRKIPESPSHLQNGDIYEVGEVPERSLDRIVLNSLLTLLRSRLKGRSFLLGRVESV